jgi:hypothetical protein
MFGVGAEWRVDRWGRCHALMLGASYAVGLSRIAQTEAKF